METEEKLINSIIHQGHNVSRIRNGRGMKQAAFADQVGMSQQRVSQIEAMPVIQETILKKLAEALEVPVEVIKNMKEDVPNMLVENNTFSLDENSNTNIGNNNNRDYINNFDPVEKVIQLSEEKARLYERLIKAEQEKNEVLEKRLSTLE